MWITSTGIRFTHLTFSSSFLFAQPACSACYPHPMSSESDGYPEILPIHLFWKRWNKTSIIWEDLNRDTSHFHYERINIGVTATLTKSAVDADVKRLVLFSTKQTKQTRWTKSTRPTKVLSDLIFKSGFFSFKILQKRTNFRIKSKDRGHPLTTDNGRYEAEKLGRYENESR